MNQACWRNLESITTHLREAVADASLVKDPGPHMVIESLLPSDIYTDLLETMPPPEAFEVADKTKANFDPSTNASGPEPWLRFHTEIVAGLLTPILVEVFRPCLAVAYKAHLGLPLADAALDLTHHAFQGRLMLRRPGYRLKPHRDKKRASLTGLIYFARPGDSREYGTELYRVTDDQQAPVMKTYYPEAHGGHAELVRTVPFIGNTALIFMNVPGMAHGAGIPRDAPQPERYAYQFYIGPPKSAFAPLVRQLPPEQAAAWNVKTSDDEY
jgi:hypothetical protein